LKILLHKKFLNISIIFKKACGYHLDLLIVGIVIGINSLLGIPWFIASTVMSLNHVLSLRQEAEAAAPGLKPK
jgi:hypothetical protein